MQNNTLAVDDRIENAKEKFDEQISIADVPEFVSQIIETIEDDVALKSFHLNEEIKYLLNYIEQAKDEISSLRPKEYSLNKLPEASDELGAIVEATEEAAEKIMDSADEISELAEKCDDDIKGKLEVISTNLFEASGFQDITGQRISKVAKILAHLEEKLSALATAVGDNDVDTVIENDNNFEKNYADMSNEELLHGPQLNDKAQDQAAIDALFDDF